jgi:hypothetical protein
MRRAPPCFKTPPAPRHVADAFGRYAAQAEFIHDFADGRLIDADRV